MVKLKEKMVTPKVDLRTLNLSSLDLRTLHSFKNLFIIFYLLDLKERFRINHKSETIVKLFKIISFCSENILCFI
jgi:hypothetical protein